MDNVFLAKTTLNKMYYPPYLNNYNEMNIKNLRISQSIWFVVYYLSKDFILIITDIIV